MPAKNYYKKSTKPQKACKKKKKKAGFPFIITKIIKKQQYKPCRAITNTWCYLKILSSLGLNDHMKPFGHAFTQVPEVSMDNWLTQTSPVFYCRHDMDEIWQDLIFFIIFQVFSTGLRSGVFPDHCKTSIFFSATHQPLQYYIPTCF